MMRIEHIAMIAHDIGLIFEFLGIISLLPLLVFVTFQEWNLVLPMASVTLTFIVLGYAISHVPHQDLEPSLSVADYVICLQVNTGSGSL